MLVAAREGSPIKGVDSGPFSMQAALLAGAEASRLKLKGDFPGAERAYKKLVEVLKKTGLYGGHSEELSVLQATQQSTQEAKQR